MLNMVKCMYVRVSRVKDVLAILAGNLKLNMQTLNMYIHLESQLNFSIPKDTVCEMYRHLSECMLANWKGSSSEIG